LAACPQAGQPAASHSLLVHGQGGPGSVRSSLLPRLGSSPSLSSLPTDNGGNGPQKSPVWPSSLTAVTPRSSGTTIVLARFLVSRHPSFSTRFCFEASRWNRRSSRVRAYKW
jgi:hypothetical protein